MRDFFPRDTCTALMLRAPMSNPMKLYLIPNTL